jgi:hypothetical protein
MRKIIKGDKMNVLQKINIAEDFDNVLIFSLIIFLIKEGGEDMMTIGVLLLLLLAN